MSQPPMRVDLRLPQGDPLVEILEKVPVGERSKILREYACKGIFMEHTIQDAVEQLKAYIKQEITASKTELLAEIKQMGISVPVPDAAPTDKTKQGQDDEFVRAFTRNITKMFD